MLITSGMKILDRVLWVHESMGSTHVNKMEELKRREICLNIVQLRSQLERTPRPSPQHFKSLIEKAIYGWSWSTSSMRKEYRNVTLELRGFFKFFVNGSAVFLIYSWNAWKTCEWIAVMFGFRLSIGQAKDCTDPKESNQEALCSILLVSTCLHLWRTACRFCCWFWSWEF